MDSISAAKVRIFDLERQANGIKQQLQQHQFTLQQIEQQQQREYIQLDILERAEAARQAEAAKKAAELKTVPHNVVTSQLLANVTHADSLACTPGAATIPSSQVSIETEVIVE